MANELSHDLDATVKERILLEERYRHEIRSSLDNKKENGKAFKLWAFLNSSFGIWLLTSILVSGLGTLYTAHQDRRKSEEIRLAEMRDQERVREANIERLDLEVAFRFSQYINILEQIHIIQSSENDERFDSVTSSDINAFMRPTPEAVNRKGNYYVNPLYDDNGNKTIIGLIAEYPGSRDQKKRCISYVK